MLTGNALGLKIEGLRVRLPLDLPIFNMTKVTYPNGVVLQYDESIVVGDIITSYHSGFHRVISIEYRGSNTTPLIEYEKVFDKDGNPKRGKNSCDASYCRKAIETLPQILQELDQKHDRLRRILLSL